MAHRRRSAGAVAWVRHGLTVGLATSVQVPLVILLSLLLDELRFAYPLVLLPLLVAGPVAVKRRTGRVVIRAAALAGLVSATVASVSLAFGMRLTGNMSWGLTSAAAAPPMPVLPRVALLPLEWMTWPQQDILVFQPILAVLLGLVTLGAASVVRFAANRSSHFLPRSLAGRLRWAFGVLTALTLVLGAVGFGMIEEIHFRIHRLQLQGTWDREVSAARSLLDADLAARLAAPAQNAPAPSSQSGEAIAAIFARLASTAQKPGVSVSSDGVAALLNRYQPLLDDAVSTHAAYRASDGDMNLLFAASVALGRLDQAVATDVDDLLKGSDRAHHERLILVMVLVAVVASIGLWTGERIVETIASPLAVLGRQLQRVARGDFSDRVPDQGPEEFGALGRAVNDMTCDLARLYAVECERRASAEALATREHELSAAKEFWANTLVHDLKGPLSLIAGWSELLEHGHHGRLDPSQAEAIRQLQNAAHALDDLVADINDSFRLQADALPMHRTALDPGDLLQSAITACRGPDRSAPDLRVAPGLDPVQADARLIGRVLHNLIGNAFKHAGAAARVVLVAEPTEDAVLFAVDDDGPGIPADDRERVFERFIQGTSAIPGRSVSHGSGLGLAFCKLVIDQLGGTIWADASPRGGTRIAFKLPLAPADLARMSPHGQRIEPAPRVA